MPIHPSLALSRPPCSGWTNCNDWRTRATSMPWQKRAMCTFASQRSCSSPRDGPDDVERLFAARDLIGERGIRRVVRQVLFTREETHHRPALLRDVVADRPFEHRVTGFDGVEDRAR